MSDSIPASPQHEKYEPHRDEGQAIGEFLDWLRNSKHYVIAQYVPRGFTDELVPAGIDVQQLLAEFFDIDYDAYLKEKEDALTWIRKQHQSQPSV